MLVSFDIHKPYCFEKKCLTQEVLSSPREVNWPTNCMWHIPYFSWNLTHLHHTHVLIDPLYYLYIDWFEHLTIMEKKTPVGKVLVCEPRTCELPRGTLRVLRIRSHQILSSNTVLYPHHPLTTLYTHFRFASSKQESYSILN
jgi:hypothetical protein